MFILLILLYILFFIALVVIILLKMHAEDERLIKDGGRGLFGEIKIFRKRYGEVRLRMCGVVQGIDARTFTNKKSYWHKVKELIVEKRKKSESDFKVLYLGLGGATVPVLVAQELPQVRQLVVEIDDALIDVVKDQFGLAAFPNIEVRQADAFELVTKKFDFKEQFDVVLIDVFSDFDSLDAPKSVESEFLAYYHGCLKADGLLMFNQPSHTHKARETVVKLEALLQKQFGRVELVRVHDWKRDFKNTILMV